MSLYEKMEKAMDQRDAAIYAEVNSDFTFVEPIWDGNVERSNGRNVEHDDEQ